MGNQLTEAPGFIDHRYGILDGLYFHMDGGIEIEHPTLYVWMPSSETDSEKWVRTLGFLFEFLPCIIPNRVRVRLRNKYSFHLHRGPKPFDRFTTNWNGEMTEFGCEDREIAPSVLWHCANLFEHEQLYHLAQFVRRHIPTDRLFLEFEDYAVELYYPLNRNIITVCPVCFAAHNSTSPHHCEAVRDTQDGTTFLLPRDRTWLTFYQSPISMLLRILNPPNDLQDLVRAHIHHILNMIRHSDTDGTEFLSTAFLLQQRLLSSSSISETETGNSNKRSRLESPTEDHS